ncbi:MAG TPA: hypothetical protein VEF36_10045 [Roseiarcus sp.]|nr:hypothetical protein [Roseiarcus sp.]
MSAPTNTKPNGGHGGRRAGAGRKPITRVATTAFSELDLRALLNESPPSDVAEVASRHAGSAILSLARQLQHGESEAAKIAAANEILDRGYGKPSVETGAQPILPFAPLPQISTSPADLRDEARKFARLAVETLRRIAENGASESGRVSASRSLLARGLGVAPTARLPDEFGARPLGKREEQAQAAAAAASGRYAPPPPPAYARKDLS